MFYSLDSHISKRLGKGEGRDIGIITGFLAAICTAPRSVEDISVSMHTARAIGQTIMLFLWMYLNSLCFLICIIFSCSGKVLQVFSLCWKTSSYFKPISLWNFPLKFFLPMIFIVLEDNGDRAPGVTIQVCLLLNLDFLSLNLVCLQNWGCSFLDHREDIICAG